MEQENKMDGCNGIADYPFRNTNSKTIATTVERSIMTQSFTLSSLSSSIDVSEFVYRQYIQRKGKRK